MYKNLNFCYDEEASLLLKQNVSNISVLFILKANTSFKNEGVTRNMIYP